MNFKNHFRLILAVIFLAASLSLPQKSLFACEIMDVISEQCCCEMHCTGECVPNAESAGECCEQVTLPETKNEVLSNTGKISGTYNLDDWNQPLTLPSPDIGPDPPFVYALAPANFSHPSWISGTNTYLLTLRLRN